MNKAFPVERWFFICEFFVIMPSHFCPIYLLVILSSLVISSREIFFHMKRVQEFYAFGGFLLLLSILSLSAFHAFACVQFPSFHSLQLPCLIHAGHISSLFAIHNFPKGIHSTFCVLLNYSLQFSVFGRSCGWIGWITGFSWWNRTNP
jgi:hypothetical protein